MLLLILVLLILCMTLPFAVWRIRREVIEIARVQRLAPREIRDAAAVLARLGSEGRDVMPATPAVVDETNENGVTI